MCLGDALDDRQSEADTGVVGAYPLGTTLKRLSQGGDQLGGEHRAGALDLERHCLGLGAGGDPHLAVFKQIVDDPVAYQMVASWRRSASEPTVGATWVVVSRVTPRSPARAKSVSVASSAIRDRSTRFGVNDRWSARLSTSNASVRSIPRVLTNRRRSTSSSLAPSGLFRATSRRVCVIASGVRSSWEAWPRTSAVQRHVFPVAPTWRRRRRQARESRHCGQGAGSDARAIRWRVCASVIRARGASIRPARSHPPATPKTRRHARTEGSSGTIPISTERLCRERSRERIRGRAIRSQPG